MFLLLSLKQKFNCLIRKYFLIYNFINLTHYIIVNISSTKKLCWLGLNLWVDTYKKQNRKIKYFSLHLLHYSVKVFYGQEPPSGESTTTECEVNYQILGIMLLK